MSIQTPLETRFHILKEEIKKLNIALNLRTTQLNDVIERMEEKELKKCGLLIEDPRWIECDHYVKCVKCGAPSLWERFTGTLNGSKHIPMCKNACVPKSGVTVHIGKDIQSLIDMVGDDDDNEAPTALEDNYNAQK